MSEFDGQSWKDAKLLLLASSGDEAERIARFCRTVFAELTVLHGNWGEKLPAKAREWQGDLIVSYCSRWIVPQALLDNARLSLNFHPAPPEYPGIGGLNWAIYEGDPTFGVTCHEMDAKVDAGRILEVRDFPLLETDDVPELFRRTHLHLECLAYDVLGALSDGSFEPKPSRPWAKDARMRSELNAMLNVSRSVGEDELARRRKAFEFADWRLNITD